MKSYFDCWSVVFAGKAPSNSTFFEAVIHYPDWRRIETYKNTLYAFSSQYFDCIVLGGDILCLHGRVPTASHGKKIYSVIQADNEPKCCRLYRYQISDRAIS